MCPDLFVYGTLLSRFDSPFARILAVEAEFLGSAYLRGRLYQVTPRYPGLILPKDPEDVALGEIFRMRDPDVLLALLDDYEGCAPRSPKPFEYGRVLTSAACDNGRSIEAWTYVYRLPVKEEDLIASGSYVPRPSM